MNFNGSHPSNNWILEHHEDLEIIPMKYAGPASLSMDRRSLVRLQNHLVILDCEIAQNKDLKLFDLEGNFIKMEKEIKFEFKKTSNSNFCPLGENQIIVLDKSKFGLPFGFVSGDSE